MPKQPRRIRVHCDIEGYEELWVEYDVSGWGFDVFVGMPSTSMFRVVTQYLEKDSVDWFIRSDEGTEIKHPGRGAARPVWDAVYKSIGPVTSQDIWLWFASSAFAALGEASIPSKKSSRGNRGDGEGNGEPDAPADASDRVDD